MLSCLSDKKYDVPELLAPAGGPKQFYAALSAGADGIYCGVGSEFNARRGADNFTEAEFAQACRVAHLAGAKVYATINVVIKQAELSRALKLVQRAWVLGADAIIMQDWGLMAAARRLLPEVRVHVSTQANVHDARGVAWCRDALGVGRVILSRELSLDEIACIAKENVELECFGHGALCMCYSGLCLLSSLRGDRSANRGLCAQPCRLPFDLVDEQGHIISAPSRSRALCMRDYNTVHDLAALRDAGLVSLKIEGRMKAADYVWAVVSAYRSALDDLARGRESKTQECARRGRLLARTFNRGFTDAYLYGRSGDELMSYERSNNRGELVGEVLGSRDLGTYRRLAGGRDGGRLRSRAYRVSEVRVHLSKSVNKGDLLELRPVDEPMQFLTESIQTHADAGSVVSLRCARPLPAGSLVRLIRSQEAMRASSAAAHPTSAPKRAVFVRVVSRIGQPFSVELICADAQASVRAEGFLVETARTREVTAQELKDHVCRMGQTPFQPIDVVVDLERGCGMSFADVHAVRAEACRLLEAALLGPYMDRKEVQRSESLRPEDVSAPCRKTPTEESNRAAASAYVSDDPKEFCEVGQRCHLGDKACDDDRCEIEICALVRTPEDALCALAAGATRIYAMTDDMSHEDTTSDRKTPSEWPKGVIPCLDEICREKDHARLDLWVRQGRPLAVGNVSELALAARLGARPELRSCIPVHNRSCLDFFVGQGACGVWLSPEMTLVEMSEVANHSKVPVGFVVYGRSRAMTTEHCVLQVSGRCPHECLRCSFRRRQLSLRDLDGALWPVRTDRQGRSRIYAACPHDVVPEIGELVAAGITRLCVDATLLEKTQVSGAVSRVVRALAQLQEHGQATSRLAGTSKAHLYSPVA